MKSFLFGFSALALSALSAHATTIITPTTAMTNAVNTGSNNLSFPDINATIDGIINGPGNTNGFIFNSTATNGTGITNATFTYTFIVPVGETLTTFDIFTVVGGAIAERVTDFDLVITDGAGTALFSATQAAGTGISEPSPVPVGGSISVDLTPSAIGAGTFTAVLTDQSGALINREFSEVQFTSIAVPEPSTGLFGLLAASSLFMIRRRK